MVRADRRDQLSERPRNIILPDVDFETVVSKAVRGCFSNIGQSCDAAIRVLAACGRHDQTSPIAKVAAEELRTGDPNSADTNLGPVVSDVQFGKTQGLIGEGIEEGTTLVAGGPNRLWPNRGYYVRPWASGNVTPGMTIALEEAFGQVLSVISYEDAIRIANATAYGLAAYVQLADI